MNLRSTLAAFVLVLAATPALAGAAVPPGLPAHMPAAATDPQPQLPEPSRATWPFPSTFPQTSGTGRLDRGAALWSDFLLDDRGASIPSGLGLSVLQASTILALAQGSYVYPTAAAKNNGADIFRTGVGLDKLNSYWRVDWLTLADASIPIAEWTFDTDADASTGASEWPAGAAVKSPGIEKALVVSSRGAWIVDPGTGARTDVAAHGGSVTVDKRSQSFIVRIPRTLMPVGDRWRVRLASGLADSAGSAFATPSLGLAGIPATGLPRTYNVTYRRVDQEPPVYHGGQADAIADALGSALSGLPLIGQMGLDGQARFITGNFWMDDDQADTLASGGDVSKFSQLVDWGRLARKALTPEPQPTGYSARWYASRLDLGGGLKTGEAIDGVASGQLASGEPTTLMRAQPYAVYVPSSYDSRHPTPLTWVLHSLEGNYNQYGGLDPHLMQQLCEERDSICATTEGYGPAGGYAREAETDFWQVWRAIGDAYRLDPERTVLTGYSMGGFGTNSLGLQHPDLYAGGMVLDGASADGPYANVKWVPYVIDNTVPDELVPPTAAIGEADSLDALGQRYRLYIHTGADHLVYATQDRFDHAVAALGRPVRKTAPGRFDYSWDPGDGAASLGIGAPGDYWIDHLGARVTKRGTSTSVVADDRALPDPQITAQRHAVATVTTPIPGITRGLTWTLGPRPAAQARMTLKLTNVGALSIDTAEAKLPAGTIAVETDGDTSVSLSRLKAGTRITLGGRVIATAKARRATNIRLSKGTLELTLSAPKRARRHSRGSSRSRFQ